jgi:hypothetical protein
MEQFLLKQNRTVSEKINTVLQAYTLMIIWVFLCSLLVMYTGYPYESIEPSPRHEFFYTIIFAPIWEELAFRYAPITFAKNLGEKYLLPTIVAVSCLFGWGHYNNPESVLLQGVLGFILSCVYIKNGYSYLSSFVLHVLWNFSVGYMFPII